VTVGRETHDGDGSPSPPFRHLGDRLVHQGYIWHVAVAAFEAPDGEVFERDVIRSPGAVGVVPLLFEDGVPTVVFVRQYRGPLDRYVLEVPAGMRDVLDEPLEVTAERELIEEAGFSAGRLEYLTHFYSSAGMTDSVLHIFLATDLVPVERDLHGPEEANMEVLRLPLAEAVDMVVRGEIHDAKTVIGLLLIDRRLRDGSLLPAP
jgi:8-oxo-dGTP pyrophosphatase MutT (NUDIX family)